MAPVTRNRGPRAYSVDTGSGSRRLALAAVSTITALGLAGCGLGGGDEEPEPTEEAAEPVEAAPLLEEALTDLAAYPALTAEGQVAPTVGGNIQETTLTVADGGASSGTVRANGIEAELVAADDKLFLRADEEFWLDKGVFGPDSDQFGGTWVRSSAEQAGINPQNTLAPPTLSTILEGIGLEDEEAVEENLDDTRAYRIDLDGERNQLWIDAETNQILRIEIEELVPEGGETGPQVRLDLARADETAAEELYTGLTTTVEEELTSSRDARIEVSWDGQPAMECEEGPHCTWSGTLRDAGASGSGTVLVRMDVTFSQEEIGDQECSDNGALEAGGTLDLACDANYDITTPEPRTYDDIQGEARLSTSGLSSDQQQEMLTALAEQREATLSGGDEETGDTEGEGDGETGGEGTEEAEETGGE
ncbi:hypothetical protein GCM10007079_43280 [Nocardiopsis terrae]|uniref:Lipoprotein n=1 Tax=Nocardiopsis terrae TaxID=372655 RepID=A0ABR9HLH1_9ACTN|nr:hypothetical protein [Nocardiopsis terrae]MBE1459856.1 hypothetical protein [Nocardiopsis terrae]GHC93643.1 hypothetical protein GCM10007079_43280 [Nocardiopsis terrae]